MNSVATISRACLRIAAAALALIVSAVVFASPAAAVVYDTPLWMKPQVCVQVDAGVDSAWHVWRAVKAWRGDSPVRLHMSRQCPARSIHVVQVSQPHADWTGLTRWEHGVRNSDRRTGSTIYLNMAPMPRYGDMQRACLMRYVSTHELGHALGLFHAPADHPESVMSYSSMNDCGTITGFDTDTLWHQYERVGLVDASAR